MKVILVVFLSSCLFVHSVTGQHNKFNIAATIKGIKDDTQFFLIKNKGEVPDTIQVVKSANESFHFNGIVPLEAEFHFIKMENTDTYITLFLDNSNISITGNTKDWPNLKVIGSPSHDDFQRMFSKINQPRAKITSIDSLIALATKQNDSVAVKQLRTEWEAANLVYVNNWKQVINDNPNSYWTPSLIMLLNELNFNEKKEAYSKLTPRAKNSRYGTELKSVLEVSAISTKIAVGNYLPSLKSRDKDGKVFSINEFVSGNKLTLIDFWASWCDPCREETPHLQKVYKEFKDKGFNILSISADYSKASWLKAIQDDKMSWAHASELKGRKETAFEIFQLNGIPASLLVDQQGKILILDLPGSTIPSSIHALRQDSLYEKVAGFLK